MIAAVGVGHGVAEVDADEDAGVVVFVAHAEDDVDAAIAHGTAGPIEQAHASVGMNQAVVDGHIAGADVLPGIEILTVKNGGPMGGIALASVLRVACEAERDAQQGEEEPGSHK